MFYNFNQNNSGGIFIVDDKVCPSLFIEADSASEAVSIAESLGCYWNGVAEGRDCPCCGDRWRRYVVEPIPLEKYSSEGYLVSIYSKSYKKAEKEWKRRYGKFTTTKEPEYDGNIYTRKICFANVEEYAQYRADWHSWATPDARIYYKDGSVKEIFASEYGSF